MNDENLKHDRKTATIKNLLNRIKNLTIVLLSYFSFHHSSFFLQSVFIQSTLSKMDTVVTKISVRLIDVSVL